MATVKRISGDYVIKTVNTGDVVEINTTAVTVDATSLTINGDLTVTGNASLTGNIAGDHIYSGTTNISIPTPSGSANISVGGVPNVAVFSTGGVSVAGNISASGNVVAGNITTTGAFSVTGNIDGANLNTTGNVWISRDASVGQPTIRFTDTDTVIVDGQVLGAVEWYTNHATGGGPRVTSSIRSIASSTLGNASVQILTSTGGAAASAKVTVLSTGNVGVGNTAPTDLLAVQGTIWGSSTISAVGNIRGGNINTAGLVSAAGNVTSGGNLVAAGYASVTGNITGGNIISLGAISAGSAGFSTVGNITGGNLNMDSAISATGNITSGDTVIAATGFSTVGNATVTGNISGGNVAVTNRVTALRFVGDLEGSVFADDSSLIVDAIDNKIYTGAVQVTGNVTNGNLITSGTMYLNHSTGAQGELHISDGVATSFVVGVGTGLSTWAGAGSLNLITSSSPGANIGFFVAQSERGRFTSSGLSVTGNVTGGNLNAAGLSLTGNVLSAINTTSNITTTGTITTNNAVVSESLSGNGVNVENIVYQDTDYVLSSATPENIGVLQFNALANQAYKFEAYIVLVPDGSTTVSPAVNFSAGSCYYTTETQITSTSVANTATKITSDNVTTTYNMTGTDSRMLRITGVFGHTANVTVSMRFQTSVANVTAKAGSYLSYTRTA